MGDCMYCGKPAGLLKKKHVECEDLYHAGWQQMVTMVKSAIAGQGAYDDLEAQLGAIAGRAHVPESHLRESLVRGWEEAVDHFLDDGDLNADEEDRLVGFQSRFRLSQDELDKRGKFLRLAKAGILRDLLNGKAPARVTVEGSLPFNFLKDEQVIWLFNDVDYFEDRTRTRFVGGSHGASVRIAKGVYYRVGAFQGEPVTRTERVQVDRGMLAVTNKHLYFGGSAKSFRIKHEKIVSIMPFADGVGVVKDAASARPQIFVTGDGWFTCNLLSNVRNL